MTIYSKIKSKAEAIEIGQDRLLEIIEQKQRLQQEYDRICKGVLKAREELADLFAEEEGRGL